MKKDSSAEPDFLPQLKDAAAKAEKIFKDVGEISFTVEKGRLYINNFVYRKLSGKATVYTAIDLFIEGIITAKEALSRITPVDLQDVFEPALTLTSENSLIMQGIGASNGIATGVLKLFPELMATNSVKSDSSIAVFTEVVPEHIRTVFEARGVLTTTGGQTSHAAVTCRGLGKPCVVGCDGRIDLRRRLLHTEKGSIPEGQYITINGFTGEIYRGKAKVKPAKHPENPRLLILIKIIDVLSSERELSVERVGAIWHMRDMLVHSVSLESEPESLNALSAWPRPRSLRANYVSFPTLRNEERLLVLLKLNDWLIPSDAISDTKYIWLGLRLCLFRLLAQHIGVGRHQQFYRPLFNPLQLVIECNDFGLSPSDGNKVQIVAEEFFGINYAVPDFIEIESIRIYAAVACSTPKELWRIDRTNPKGEKLMYGSRKLIALKVVVNDALVTLSDLPLFYNYFRRKEYFWGWYNHHKIARQEIIRFLINPKSLKDENHKVRNICRQAGLISQSGVITKVGRSLISEPNIETRRNDYVRMLGD